MSLRVILLATMERTVREIASMSIACDLGRGVEVRHDLAGDQLRVVATDHTGLVYRDEGQLEHGCLSCAVREGLVPLLRWIQEQGRWDTVCVSLPLTASPLQVSWTIEGAIAEGVLVDTVLAQTITALDESTFTDDLLGDDLVGDRGLQLAQNDQRAVGEALWSMTEGCDTVVTLGDPDAATETLLDHVLDPDTRLWPGISTLPVLELAEDESMVTRTPPRWAPEANDWPLPEDRDGVWSIVLASERAFHPGRLLEQIELIGTGRVLARGCFWLPSRPGSLCAWDGSGGQLSIGEVAPWGSIPRRTLLRITGTDVADRERIVRSFRDVLLTDHEVRTAIARWQGRSDGLERWLGENSVGEAG